MHTDAPADELAPALPDEVPVLPLREFVAFPYMVLPLFAARERSIAAVDDALAGHRTVLLVAQRDASQNDPDPDDLYRVGTLGVVLRAMHLADGRVKVLVQCQRKARIDSFIPREGCDWVRATPLAHDEEEGWSVELADPEYGVAPGQACVFYDGSRVLGGGWIRREAPARAA